MDEKVLEEIRFHQDVVAKDAGSPLFQIREKEMEISGRVLAARDKSEKIVADARKEATEIVKSAEAEGEKLAKEHTEKVMAEAQVEVVEVGKQAEKDTGALEKELAKRHAAAVDFVVELVTSV